MTEELQEIRRAAYEQVDRELFPQQLAWTIQELKGWRARPETPVSRQMIELLEMDARRLNQVMRGWVNG